VAREPLAHVVREDGLGVDLHVHELFGAERLDGLDTSAQPASVGGVASPGLVERFRPDADRDRPPQEARERGPRLLHLGPQREHRRANAADEGIAFTLE
jgi:hypothetical protein